MLNSRWFRSRGVLIGKGEGNLKVRPGVQSVTALIHLAGPPLTGGGTVRRKETEPKEPKRALRRKEKKKTACKPLPFLEGGSRDTNVFTKKSEVEENPYR